MTNIRVSYLLLTILCHITIPAYSNSQPYLSEARSNEESETELRSRLPVSLVQRERSSPGHRATIMFPDSGTNSPNETLEADPMALPRKFKGHIPLKILRRLSSERDLSRIFEKYVSNVKVQDADGQKYLVDLRGRPIDAGLEGNVSNDPPVEKIVTTKIGAFFHRQKQAPFLLQQERVGIPTRVTKPAVCEPELRTVEIPAPNDPNIVQFPKCVRLERCGGCCGSDLLSCEPKRSRPVEVQVQKFAYNDENEKLEYRETEILNLLSHTECQCLCRVKVGDCSARHVYSNEDCLCLCKNRGEQELCTQNPSKLWDPSLCQCVCREIKACSSGYLFDIDTCDCVVNLERRRIGETPTTEEEDQSTRRNRRANSRVRFLN